MSWMKASNELKLNWNEPDKLLTVDTILYIVVVDVNDVKYIYCITIQIEPIIWH